MSIVAGLDLYLLEDCKSLRGCPDDVADALNESKSLANDRDESSRLL